MTPSPTRLERRKTDRRGRGRVQPTEESWFGALGLSTAAPAAEEGWVDADEPGKSAGGSFADPAAGEAHFLSREARRIVSSGVTAFERIYAAFVAARAALGVALLSTQLVSELLGVRPRLAVTMICLTYAAQTLILWLLPRFRAVPNASARKGVSRLSGIQWLSTIGFDVLCFAALHLAAPASGLNYVALFVLPVLTAGVLTSRLAALACAAAVALILLLTAWLGVVAGGDAALGITQAGLAGSGFFVITLLAGELASRLAREELTARGSLEFARQQAQLNRLVLEEMDDGVLVVDRKGKVRAANPAARSLLAPSGMARPAPFQLRGVEAWGPLVAAVERAFAEAVWPEAGRDISLPFSPALVRTLRLRVRFTRKREAEEASEDFCVLFIEDVRTMQARTRQERLAAMGRVSAGIAHEIRNPLAAIAQANALMAEDAIDPGQRRLTQMVTDNVERLKRIVDDVMELAPGDPQSATVIDASATVLAICSEWARTTNVAVGEAGPLVMDVPHESLGAVFDAEHLRRVLVNLLDNARRHGRELPGSIVLRLSSRGDGPVVLSVASGGPLIPPEVERYLFEPFFSSRSRGTGLGLYICRELCERYGASIEYRQRGESEINRNEFVVMMRREALQPPFGTPLRSLFT